jgi:asparagine synthase (glutamine-hydrolysing)
MKQRPRQLSGWMGAPSCDAEGAKARLRAAGALPASSDAQSERGVAAGSNCIVTAPCVSVQDGLIVGIRGDPIWRTQEPRNDDAGALLQAYRTYGRDFLGRLHGSFALVVLDTANKTALLAVDRMGIERLTYRLDGEELTFGTSAELVARSCDASPRISVQSLLSYLFFHMVPSPDTVFEGVRKIPPATAVLFETGTLTEYRYWQPHSIAPGRTEEFTVLQAALHAALRAGVSAARPDERTGAFLSGGLDSSTVSGYLGLVTTRPAPTFSIGFGFDKYDEIRYARIASKHFHSNAHEYQVRPDDITDAFQSIAARYDEPFGNASALPTLCCARLALSNGVDHLLAGDGGDELFAGNSRYADQLIFARYQRLPGVFRRQLLEPALAAIPAPLRIGILRKARNYVRQANTPLPERLETYNYMHRLGFDAMLHPEFAAAVDLSGPEQHMRSVYTGISSTSDLSRMLEYDWRLTLADNDLRKVGTMCELAGVQVSFPMLHPDVIDVSLRVPPELMMHGTQLRTFYKRAMADFLPHETINKTKQGFGLPFGLWLQRSPRLADIINENLTGLRARHIVRSEFIDRLSQLRGDDDANYYGPLIWTLAMLEQWFREHRIAPP